ncbi:MAG: S8 family serine peptidase [Firmicutes bacterium]|nr:S8 family serine peptidase [Bacillota bacterium]
MKKKNKLLTIGVMAIMLLFLTAATPTQTYVMAERDCIYLAESPQLQKSVYDLEFDQALTNRMSYTNRLANNFCTERIVVVLDSDVSYPNKEHPNIFGRFSGAEVVDLMPIEHCPKYLNIDVENFRQIFEVRLPQNARTMASQRSQAYSVISTLARTSGVLYAGPSVYDIDAMKAAEVAKEYAAYKRALELEIQSTYENLIKTYSQEIAPSNVGFPFATNDPLFLSTAANGFTGGQWALRNSPGIRADYAWSITRGCPYVRVGVIDTGIYDRHEDLQINLVPGRCFVTNREGCITYTRDTNGHGTNIAGIIGADGDNGRGISGIAQRVQLVPLRIGTGMFTQFTAEQRDRSIAAIVFAINTRIHILNYSHSIGSIEYDVEDANPTALHTAIRNFPGLFVTIANNQNRNIRNLNLPTFNNMIIVGAHNQQGRRWYNNSQMGSNWCNITVDLFAPGHELLTTGHRNINYYLRRYGTSNAAPHVAGTAALMMSANHTLRNQAFRVKHYINSTVDNYRNTFIPDCIRLHSITGGRLNAQRAVEAVAYIRNLSQNIYRPGIVLDINYNHLYQHNFLINQNFTPLRFSNIPEGQSFIIFRGESSLELDINCTITGLNRRVFGGQSLLLPTGIQPHYWIDITNNTGSSQSVSIFIAIYGNVTKVQQFANGSTINNFSFSNLGQRTLYILPLNINNTNSRTINFMCDVMGGGVIWKIVSINKRNPLEANVAEIHLDGRGHTISATFLPRSTGRHYFVFLAGSNRMSGVLNLY